MTGDSCPSPEPGESAPGSHATRLRRIVCGNPEVWGGPLQIVNECRVVRSGWTKGIKIRMYRFPHTLLAMNDTVDGRRVAGRGSRVSRQVTCRD
jgi:hypothetical protein